MAARGGAHRASLTLYGTAGIRRWKWSDGLPKCPHLRWKELEPFSTLQRARPRERDRAHFNEPDRRRTRHACDRWRRPDVDARPDRHALARDVYRLAASGDAYRRCRLH